MGFIFEDAKVTAVVVIAVVIVVLMLIIHINDIFKRRKHKIIVEKLQKELQTVKNRQYNLELNKETLETRINDLTKAKEQLAKVAYSDYLTGLPNRNALINMLDGVMFTLRSEENIALTIIDISDFRDINTTLGYPHGDELLIDVTHLLQENLDENDYLTRYGADEFAILTQNISDMNTVTDKMKKIQLEFEKPFVLAAKQCTVNMNIGIAIAPKDGKTTQVIMKNAESALKTAQESDKNSFCFFSEAINQSIIKKLELKAELRKAIEENQFIILYQKQMNLITGEPIGFEALLRWDNPDRGLLSPDEFLNLAEESGLIIQIGDIVLFKVCKFIKKLEEKAKTAFSVTVNISEREFRDRRFLDRVRRCINDVGISSAYLEFEIKEKTILADFENAKYLLSELKKSGIRLSISDFGAGYSTMNYLKYVKADNLKIGKDYLSDLMQDESDRKILELVINLARSMDFNVIAEGVEEIDQEELLKNVKCNMAQGYLYSELLDEESALEVL